MLITLLIRTSISYCPIGQRYTPVDSTYSAASNGKDESCFVLMLVSNNNEQGINKHINLNQDVCFYILFDRAARKLSNGS